MEKIKSKGQALILLIALVSLVLGSMAMLRTPTLILPPWFLLALYLPLMLGVSFILGFLAKALMKLKAGGLVYASVFITLFSLAFYIYEYKPAYEIIVPDHFKGEVRLFVSNEEEDNFQLNAFGVGYISKETYHRGFIPMVIQNKQDITSTLSGFSEGSILFNSINGKAVSYKYLSFNLSENVNDTILGNLPKLIEIRAVDTARISK